MKKILAKTWVTDMLKMGILTCFLLVSQNIYCQDGTLDLSFNTGTIFSGVVRSLAVQPDGKIIANQTVNAGGIAQRKVIRLYSNGTPDASFNSGSGLDNDVYCIVIQPDDKILVGGWFTSYNGVSKKYLVRLNSNGSIDTSFNSELNYYVFSLAIQPDGKIIVGGSFTEYNSTPCPGVARLNQDGSLDTSFSSSLSGTTAFYVRHLVIQQNGKVVVCGNFNNTLARLNSDGTIDTSFTLGEPGFDGEVARIAVQPDGKLIVVGGFVHFNSTVLSYIARLNINGTLDQSFDPGSSFNDGVLDVIIQPDGKIIAGGYFSSYRNTPCGRIIRLYPDGTKDNSFNTGASGFGPSGSLPSVHALALQPDGKVLVGGFFSMYNTTSSRFLARLYSSFSDPCAGISADAGPDFSAIQNSGTVILSGSPSGGIWSGTGVNASGVFDISQPLGSYTLTYCYTTPQNCTACDEVVVTINSIYYRDQDDDGWGSNTDSVFAETQPLGYLIDKGDCNDNNPNINPGIAEVCNGIDDNCDGIVDNISQPLSVFITPESTSFCQGESVELTAVADAGVQYLWSTGATTQSIIVSTSGSYTVQVSRASCPVAVSSPRVVTVHPLPTTNAGTDFSAIQNSSNVTLTGTPSGGTWSGTGVTNGVFDASQPIGSYPLVYCYTSSQGCSRCDTVVATITTPTITEIVKPVISPATGTYPDPVSVTITCATPGVTIYYTTSGNLPVVGAGFTKVYTGPFPVIQSTSVRAIAVLTGLPNSPVAVSFITITNPGICATPVVTPGTGSYNGQQTVTLSTTTSGASIYYTTNGNLPRLDVPNSFTRLHSGPFQINASSVIKAVAVKAGLENSPFASANISITSPTPYVATPVITPATGLYASAQTVSISTSSPGATIYYTTSGNVPVIGTGFTKVYSGSFTLASSATVRAMATAPDLLQSAVAVSYITIGAARAAVNDESEWPENEVASDLRAFPNPTSGDVQLVLNAPVENVVVEIFNSLGQSVDRQSFTSLHNQSLSLSAQPAGIYLVKVQATNFQTEVRVVKR